MTHAFVSQYAVNRYVRSVFVHVQLVIAEKALQKLEQHERARRLVYVARLTQRAVAIVVLLTVFGAFAQIASVLERIRVAQTIRLVHQQIAIAYLVHQMNKINRVQQLKTTPHKCDEKVNWKKEKCPIAQLDA